MYSDIFCQVYNRFGWNYYPEAFGQQLLDWMEESGFHPASVLDLACGTGVLCRILKEQGMEVSGVDLSPGMIAIAREGNPDIPFHRGDMTLWQPECPVDLVTCTGDAVNHLPHGDMVQTMFRTVYESLTPGGYFVFDLLNEQEVSDSEPFVMDFAPGVQVWFRMTRPEPRQVNLTIRVLEQEVRTLEETIRETLHDPADICRMLEQAGFRVLRLAHSLTAGEGPQATTWFLVARRPAAASRR